MIDGQELEIKDILLSCNDVQTQVRSNEGSKTFSDEIIFAPNSIIS